MSTEHAAYLAKLKTWALWVLAVLLLTVVNALVSKWIGGATLPQPPAPVIVVAPQDATGQMTVTVVKP